VVSVHDVAPQTFPAVRRILEDLDSAGVRKRTLLVVPRFHRETTLESDPQFRDFLGSRDPATDEICLHGFEHISGPRRYNGVARLIATRYTDNEGEFYRLETPEAVRLVEQGLEDMNRLGIAPRGFIAPAWLMPLELEPELQRLGFLYTTRLWSFISLRPEIRHFRAPALVYSARRRWRIALSLMWNPSLWRMSWFVDCLRVVIHPCDWKTERFRRQILGILRIAGTRRRIMTYRDLAAAIAGEEPA
jgi:predicted deacetylase